MTDSAARTHNNGDRSKEFILDESVLPIGSYILKDSSSVPVAPVATPTQVFSLNNPGPGLNSPSKTSTHDNKNKGTNGAHVNAKNSSDTPSDKNATKRSTAAMVKTSNGAASEASKTAASNSPLHVQCDPCYVGIYGGKETTSNGAKLGTELIPLRSSKPLAAGTAQNKVFGSDISALVSSTASHLKFDALSSHVALLHFVTANKNDVIPPSDYDGVPLVVATPHRGTVVQPSPEASTEKTAASATKISKASPAAANNDSSKASQVKPTPSNASPDKPTPPKVPVKPKNGASAEQSSGKVDRSFSYTSDAYKNIQKLPLEVQCDPIMVGMFSEATAKVTPAPSAVKEALISLPKKPRTYQRLKSSNRNSANLPSSAKLTTHLEFEPLMSNMVPKDVADEINEHIEMSKSGIVEEEVPVPATAESPEKKEEQATKDWQALPTNISGKVAFFERLMKQTPEKPKDGLTVKVKTGISEKVQSAHQQVQTSLQSGVVKANGSSGKQVPEQLPTTPLAIKRERVQNFFPQQESNNTLPKQAPSKPVAAQTEPRQMVPTSELDSKPDVAQETTEPQPKVNDVVSEVEKRQMPMESKQHGTTNGHAVKAIEEEGEPVLQVADHIHEEVKKRPIQDDDDAKPNQPAKDREEIDARIATEESIEVKQPALQEVEDEGEPSSRREENEKKPGSAVMIEEGKDVLASRDLNAPVPDANVEAATALHSPVRADTTKGQDAGGALNEDVQGEQLSRNLAIGVLEEQGDSEERPESPGEAESVGSFPPLVATSSKEDYPDIVKANKSPQRSPPDVFLRRKSYASALAEGKKLAHRKLNIAKANIPEAVNETEQDSGAIETKHRLAEIARVLADASPQRKVKEIEEPQNEVAQDEDSRNEVAQDEEPQDEVPQNQAAIPRVDSSIEFREIARRKKASEDSQDESQLLEAKTDDENKMPLPSHTAAKANTNQYSVLIDSGESPEKKSKHKKKSREHSNGEPPRKIPEKVVAFKDALLAQAKDAKKKGTTSREGLPSNIAEQRPPILAIPLHIFNNLVHRKPFSYVFDGAFWFLVLVLGGPLAAIGMVFLTIYRMASYLLRLLGIGIIKPKNYPNRELAVVVTGCDSGFGRELAHALTADGFVVFCCCLNRESFKAFEGDALAIPLRMDVTKDKDVDAAAKVVRKWMAAEDGRYIHALVNNAGIGMAGSVDWLPQSHFERMIDVNFYGMVRSCKKFLPLFKQQAAEGFYTGSRIVNMVSIAGLMKGAVFSVGYEASKHAADAFTTTLRLETEKFGLKVSAINPSFHKTPLTEDMTADLKKTWNALTPEKRKQYGEDYLGSVAQRTHIGSHVVNWDWRNVVDAMEKCVMFKNPPARVLVGIDARYTIIFLKILPTWLLSWFLDWGRPLPAMMRD